jgi:hypothetical protein
MSATRNEDMGNAQRHPNAELAPYVSHRRVKAARIASVDRLRTPNKVRVEIGGAWFEIDTANKPSPHEGWWFVLYEDGYFSFCPPESFEKGYQAVEPSPFEPGECVELRLRRFFAANEADAVPAVTIVGPADQDWSRTVARVGAKLGKVLTGAPLTNVRVMTRDELKAYLAGEEGGEE